MKPLRLLVLGMIVMLGTGCSVFQRSDDATNVEDEKSEEVEPIEASKVFQRETGFAPMPISTAKAQRMVIEPSTSGRVSNVERTQKSKVKPNPAPQEVKPSSASSESAEEDFEEALNEQTNGEPRFALSKWKKFLDDHTGMPGYESAKFNYALCLYLTGKPSEALDYLRPLYEEEFPTQITTEARLLSIEALIGLSRFEDALALSFEILPDYDAEARSGLFRRRGSQKAISKFVLHDDQKIRVYTLRSVCFAGLKKADLSSQTIARATAILDTLWKTSPQTSDIQYKLHDLRAHLSYRAIQALTLHCQTKNPFPTTLSEAEALAYGDSYYRCALPATKLYCDFLESQKVTENESLGKVVLQDYTALALHPLKLRDPLPPPSRHLKRTTQKPFYEQEMKGLIEKMVDEKIKPMRFIDSCHADHIF